jgi:hypothetical protein
MSDSLVSARLWRLTAIGLLITFGGVIGLGLSIASGLAPRANQTVLTGFDDRWSIESGAIDAGRLELHPIGLALHPIEATDFTFQARVAANDPVIGTGLIIRARDRDNFVAFLISGDGYFSLGEMRAGVWLDRNPWRAWPHVRRLAANLLRAECAGSSCVFFVNDERTLAATDLPAGQSIGLLARAATADRSFSAVFDQIAVWPVPR